MFKLLKKTHDFKAHVVCDAKVYVDTDGREGNVDKVFKIAIETHIEIMNKRSRREDKKKIKCFCDFFKKALPDVIHRPYQMI